MDYVKHINTAHSTYTAESPLVTQIHLTKGKLVGGWIYFPPGPAGLLHVTIKRGLHQIAPSNTDADYAMDDCVVPLFLNRVITAPPVILEILTWNASTQEDHACDVAIFLDPFASPTEPRSWLDRIKGLIK